MIEAGATFEFRVAKKPGSPQLELVLGKNGGPAGPRAKGGKKFADLLWPGRVLIEMKSRGAKLEKYYDQAFEYWQLIVPHRPHYVILCNFDEFWIYDFNEQLFDPVERVTLRELPENVAPFNFLLPVSKRPIFGNNWVDVTRRAADQMAIVFREIVDRGEDREKAQRFILQLLVAMVAEDISLLPDQLLSELLHDCADRGGSSYDLIGGLFRQMATDRPATGGRYVGVQYFNGGLYREIDPVELKHSEAYRLCEAAAEDWSKVKPEIFGTLFQQSMDSGGRPGTRDERHAFGAHFTSEFDIQKVVGPTIVRPWRERIEACGRDKSKLRAALSELRNFQVLDPACGSGNFLFVAYREMKRLERDLLARLKRAGAGGTFTSEVKLSQFFGIDILPFAAELAKVTLMLAKELEIREARAFGQSEDLFIEEKALPLENLDANILCADALFTPWPAADAIIGNPPFQSKNKIVKEFGRAYVDKVRKAFPSVPGRADFCVYWFKKAHDHLPSGHRAGLVGTNTIRQNYSRQGGLDYIVQNGGVITDAVGTEVWSGDAVVYVSIVNWIKDPDATQLPKVRKLSLQRGDDVDSPWDSFELDNINSALSVGTATIYLAQCVRKRVTLWDIVNTLDIERLVTALRQLAYGSAAFQSDDQRMDVRALIPVCNALRNCEEPFLRMGLKTSAGMINKFLDSANRNMEHGDWTGTMVAEKCHAVFSAIQCETIGFFCFKMESENAKFFEKKLPFGNYVSAGFAECTEDIFEAHQCLALERYTAGMFHVGRAMEIAVKRVAKKMGVKAHRDEWQAYLSAMNEKINKMPFKTPADKARRIPLAEVAGHLFNFKEAWRNPTFHAKKTYTRDEAFSALTNAGAFMDSVARNILKVKP